MCDLTYVVVKTQVGGREISIRPTQMLLKEKHSKLLTAIFLTHISFFSRSFFFSLSLFLIVSLQPNYGKTVAKLYLGFIK